jgi:maltose alpha-D-glucosyltransferase/alpha-amylase
LADEIAEGHVVALDLLTKGWSGWLAGHGAALLESALPTWLPRRRWFGAKSRTIQNVRLLDWIELRAPAPEDTTILSAADLPAAGTLAPVLLYVEVGYAEDASDVYQVPLAFTTGAGAEHIAATYPSSVLATLSTPEGPAILHDATIREDARQGLLALIARNATLPLATTRTAALEVAASLAAAANGRSAREAVASGEAADLLQHLERATASSTAVHLRPHELFPAPDFDGLSTVESGTDPSRRPLAIEQSVAPVSIDAQPGEAGAPPRSSTPAAPTAAQRIQPRESPTAGDPRPLAGHLDARASAAFGSNYSQRLPSRIVGTEQSNTSIIYGQEFILKLFRRLQPGENPEAEIGRYLTESVRFPHIPPFMGEISITPDGGEKTTAAILQGLVPNECDGWSWFLNRIAGFFKSIANLPAPLDQPSPSLLAGQVDWGETGKLVGTVIEDAALLGRRTAEMHLALATPTEDSAFAPVLMTHDSLKQDMRRIEAHFTSALEMLKSKFATFDDFTADAAAHVMARRRPLLTRIHDLAGLQLSSGQLTRIHGDYHLGQTLRTTQAANSSFAPGDFVLLDFEGEPARSLAERRQKQSPLKDVAGMLRSFSYAAYAGLGQFTNAERILQPDDLERLTGWARFWERVIAFVFLRAYRETIAVNANLCPPPAQAQTLLNAYLLEKALYEVRYELNNRPAWLRIPLAGILAL